MRDRGLKSLADGLLLKWPVSVLYPALFGTVWLHTSGICFGQGLPVHGAAVSFCSSTISKNEDRKRGLVCEGLD